MKKLLIFVICCFAVGVAMAEFKAGFSKVDITPAIGTPVSGNYRYRVAQNILDHLHARCVAVSDGEKTALIFSIDSLFLTDGVVKRVKKAISEKTKVKADAVFLACTHIHTGASTYYSNIAKDKKTDKALVNAANNMMVERCVEAAAKAVADMVPSRILVGRGEATDISFIRRFKMKDGTYRTNPSRNDPNVVGPVGNPDESLQLVRFVREGAKEIALMNFQCHPDVIGGNTISADWPGLSCDYLERALEGNVHAILVNGAQGDTNHIRQRWVKGNPLPSRYDMAHHMGRTVAGSAMKVWGFCREVPVGKVNAVECKVKVKVNKAPVEDLPRAKAWLDLYLSGRGKEVPGKGMEHVSNLAWASRAMATRNWPDEKYIPVPVVTIGRSLAFGGFAGEPFTEMGCEVKRRSKFTMTVPACCTNGYYGYFPTADAFTIGGYENATSRYAKGTAERLVEGMVAQLNEFYVAAE